MTMPSPRRQDAAPTTGQGESRPVAAAVALGDGSDGGHPLDMLGYSLSHDLRAPLRAIDGYLQALVEDFGGQLPLEARDVVSRIRTASHTIDARIDALLRLSESTRGGAEVTLQPCDLAAIAAPLVDQHRRAEPGRAVLVRIAPAMLVDGDPALLGIVVDNLLGNAWKYTRPRDPARIEMTYRRDPERVVVSVSDNGIGFDMSQAHRLGVPFQRLHGVQSYEGVGIGLASSIRILARHGGRLWAEGSPGQGATFSFSLPLPRNR